MILIGNQRGGAKELALHLLKEENDHVEIHELRGFAARDLRGAFNEAYAVSRGTRCKQYLFSLSLNPPAMTNVTTEDFEAAIARIETELGLTGQPRAIVFHEKGGRGRHAHCVWSRIRADEMKAVPLPFTHKKLMRIARELYIEHRWKMPRGLTQSAASDPRNFTLAQWQQAKRSSQDPRAIKTAIQDAWAISDTKAALTRALIERGYRLARGDSRAFVVVDRHGEIYSLPRWLGVKTKEVRARVGHGDDLPDIATVKAQIASEVQPVLIRLKSDILLDLRRENTGLRMERSAMLARHREARHVQATQMEMRRWEEARIRQSRFRSGLKGIWDWVRGETERIRLHNEVEARAATRRDRAEIDALIFAQLEEKRRMIDLRREIAAAYAERSRDIRGDLRLLIEGVHAILRSTRTRARQMVVTSDVTLSRVLSAEGISNLCLPIPTLTDEPLSNVRYDPWAQTFVGTTIGGMLWDLAHTFGSVRLDDGHGEKVRLSCYWPGKIPRKWQSEQLSVTWATKAAAVGPIGAEENSGPPGNDATSIASEGEPSFVQAPNSEANGDHTASLSDAAVPQASLPLVLRLAGAVYASGGGTIERLVESITSQQPAKGNAPRGYEILRRAKLIDFNGSEILPRVELDALESNLRAGDLDPISAQFENYDPYRVVLDALRNDGSLARSAVNDLLEKALQGVVAQEASVRLVRYHILLGQAWTDGSIWRDGSNRPTMDVYIRGFSETFDQVAHDNIAKVSDFLPRFCRTMHMSPWAATRAAQSYISALSAAYSLQYAVGGKPTGTDKIISGSLLDVVESIVPLDRIEIGGRPVLTLGRVKK